MNSFARHSHVVRPAVPAPRPLAVELYEIGVASILVAAAEVRDLSETERKRRHAAASELEILAEGKHPRARPDPKGEA